MIKLKHLNIRFKYPVIEEAEIEIHPNEITLITGDSGNGKTSILNILGLLDLKNKREYYWNEKQIEEKEYQSLKRTKISYVFQDYNAIEDLSVEDNFRTMFNIAGRRYKKQEMNELLDKVSLSLKKTSQKCKSLSGGEKQRLAIALALVKHPQLLLLDEPTANLDETNAIMIVDILKKLKEEGLMIVVASHHPEIYGADHIYRIEENQLIEVKKKEAEIETSTKKETRKKMNPWMYSMIHMMHHFVLYGVMLLVICWSMFNITDISIIIVESYKGLNNSFKEITNTEIFINNVSNSFEEIYNFYYNDIGLKISKETMDKIKKIDHVKSIYPYYIKSEIELDKNAIPDERDVTIYSKNNKVNVFEKLQDYYYVATCKAKDKEKNCTEVDENVENGVFISRQLANALNIKKLDHTEITFNMPIIMGYYQGESYLIDENGEEGDRIEMNVDLMYKKKVTYEIQGIYEKNVNEHGYYDAKGGEKIYIDYREYEKLHNLMLKDKEAVKKYNGEVYELMSANVGAHDASNEMLASCYVLYVDDSDNVEQVIEEINDLDIEEELYIKTKKDAVDNVKGILNDIYTSYYVEMAVLIGVAIVLITILYIYTLYCRKKEIAYLMANGLNKSYLYPMIDMAYIMLLSIPAVIGCTWNPVRTIPDFEWIHMLPHMIVIILFMMICFVVNVLFYKKLDVIKQLRSK